MKKLKQIAAAGLMAGALVSMQAPQQTPGHVQVVAAQGACGGNNVTRGGGNNGSGNGGGHSCSGNAHYPQQGGCSSRKASSQVQYPRQNSCGGNGSQGAQGNQGGQNGQGAQNGQGTSQGNGGTVTSPSQPRCHSKDASRVQYPRQGGCGHNCSGYQQATKVQGPGQLNDTCSDSGACGGEEYRQAPQPSGNGNQGKRLGLK